MRFLSKARVGVVTKEDKQARLKAFIGKHAEQMRAAEAPAGTVTYRLLALSSDSPAVLALTALGPELEAAGIKSEIILARRSRAKANDPDGCRFIDDLRLLEAHELLVLDDATVWIGDCMRRDPVHRDAYEHFYEASPETAARAARSFEQIARTVGRGRGGYASRQNLSPLPSLFDPALLAGTDAGPPATALLRH